MKILFDHNTPRRLRRYLRDHQITTTQQLGWERIGNGLLLQSAAIEGFDVLLTLDKKMEYEQNLAQLPLPIVLMGIPLTAMEDLIPHVPTLRRLLSMTLTPALYIVRAGDIIERLNAPRK